MSSEIIDIAFARAFDSEPVLSAPVPLGGGCISKVVQVRAGDDLYVIKINSSKLYPAMFEAEKQGLELLASASSGLKIPRVIAIGQWDSSQWLIMEYIKESPLRTGFWEYFGRSLALLHQSTHDHFGLSYNNWIGSLVQINTPSPKFWDFYFEQRLRPLVVKAGSALNYQDHKAFESLFFKYADLFSHDIPTLIHGDLWSGNFLKSEIATLIDPAVYYGISEIDLAMTRLFGGFDERFYHAYAEVNPPHSNAAERIKICTLYPLLVHVNLFGGGYVGQLRSLLKSLL
jgi:fructosamine-3-kinase